MTIAEFLRMKECKGIGVAVSFNTDFNLWAAHFVCASHTSLSIAGIDVVGLVWDADTPDAAVDRMLKSISGKIMEFCGEKFEIPQLEMVS